MSSAMEDVTNTIDGPTVLLSVDDDGVAIVSLNRPSRANAMTAEMGARYVEVLAQVDADPDVRAVVVTGSGAAFCAGADMAALDRAGHDGGGEGSRTQSGDLATSYLRPMRSPKPYIAAVNGPCVGVGLALAAACDVRIVASSATIAASFARLGLVADFGLSWVLPRIMGTARAMDLLLSGRRVTGEEAASLGLANHSLDEAEVLPSALTWARDVATRCSPWSLRTIKQQVYGDLERGLADAYGDAVGLMKTAFAGPDLAEGIAAFAEKRRPAFPPLPTPTDDSQEQT